MGAFQPGILTRNPWVPRRPISVREYHLMGETGILHEDDRVELIEGEIDHADGSDRIRSCR